MFLKVCKLFHMIVLQFVGGVLGGFIVGLMATSFKRTYATIVVFHAPGPVAGS